MSSQFRLFLYCKLYSMFTAVICGGVEKTTAAVQRGTRGMILCFIFRWSEFICSVPQIFCEHRKMFCSASWSVQRMSWLRRCFYVEGMAWHRISCTDMKQSNMWQCECVTECSSCHINQTELHHFMKQTSGFWFPVNDFLQAAAGFHSCPCVIEYSLQRL